MRGRFHSSKQDLVPLNLERLQHWIDKGLIDPTQPITMKELYETRCVHGVHDGVKLLGDASRFFFPPLIPLSFRTLDKQSDPLFLDRSIVGRSISHYPKSQYHCIKSISIRNSSNRIPQRNLHSTLREPSNPRSSPLSFLAPLSLHPLTVSH